MNEEHEKYMKRAIALAKKAVETNTGGPFGAVVVKNGKIIAEGHNNVLAHKDPTAHAEIVAIRKACRELGSFQLDDCILYTSCEPCPMCFGAIYWARPKKVFYACSHSDAASVGFDDSFIYKELKLDEDKRAIDFERILGDEALAPFKLWDDKEDKQLY